MLFETARLSVVPDEEDLIECIDTSNSKFPDSIDYSEAFSKTVSAHPEVTTDDLQKTLAFTRSLITAENEVYAVTLRNNSKIIGYFQVLNQNSATPSIGIGLFRDYQRQGYGTELLRAAVDAFSRMGKYTELKCFTWAANTASIGMIEKVGGALAEPEFEHQHLFYREYSFPLSNKETSMEFETERLYTKSTDEDFLDYIDELNKEHPSPDITELLEMSLAEHANEIVPKDFRSVMTLCQKWRGNTLETLKVIRKEDNEVIGYFQFMDADTSTPNVGLGFVYKYRHQGYGTELLHGAIEALRRAGGYDAMLYVASVHNPNSIALVEKCGGVLQEPEFPHLHFFFKEYKLPVSDN